jgi:hypothetical protein
LNLDVCDHIHDGNYEPFEDLSYLNYLLCPKLP